MLSFPNAKINLGLNVISKRPDGYHNIETCFYPIPLKDIIEIIPSDSLQFTSSGHSIPGNPENNLCLKAYHLLKQNFDLPPVHIYLHKVIPMGAGLGGGSADGAYMLKLLNEKFELKLTPTELEVFAGELGSDCPFFIGNKPVFAEGTGTDFSEININLKGKYIALSHPKIHVSTQEAYSGVSPKIPKKSIKDILKQPIATWKAELVNDFETSVFERHPKIKSVKDHLYENGAIYASMSGSGSSVFGVFEEKPRSNTNQVFELT